MSGNKKQSKVYLYSNTCNNSYDNQQMVLFKKQLLYISKGYLYLYWFRLTLFTGFY